MDRFISCISHISSEGKLLIGTEATALFDCGMLFCAEETIGNIEATLKGRPLDKVFLTHTHYDHVGALPLIRKRWPQVQVYTSEIGAAVLLKSTPRRVFRELSGAAAMSLGSCPLNTDYEDDAYRADATIADGDSVSLGDLTVKAIETPGHTRDSMSFFIPGLKLMVLSETTGVMMPNGVVMPCYLTSFNDTMTSLNKCRQMDFEYISLPHCGVPLKDEASSFFDKSETANVRYRDFVIGLYEKGFDEDAISGKLSEEYCDETLMSMQPRDAFTANAQAAVATTIREYEQSKTADKQIFTKPAGQ